MTDNAGNVKQAAQAASDLSLEVVVLAGRLYAALDEIVRIQSNVGHRVGMEPDDLRRIRDSMSKVSYLHHKMDRAIDDLWS